MLEEPLFLTPSDTPVRARDLQPDMEVRPPGWFDYHTVLAVEPGIESFVRVLWRVDADDDPPDPYTVFYGDEWFAQR